jgi:signal transduction histidine kinase
MQQIDQHSTASEKLGPSAAAADARSGQDGPEALALRDLRLSVDRAVQQRKALEQQVADLRGQLKEALRQSSLVEVATGALHNVGNVLNSINVGASRVGERLRQSRIGNLGQALCLLRQHQTEWAAFLTEDPQGRQLPDHLETLVEHLAAEHAEMVREIEALLRDIEHVKEIVSVQQAYVRKCGILETVPPVELVEDALRMNWGAFERHGIRIIRKFGEVPRVTVDRHGVLQILINLIRNAKYALAESSPSEKRLVVGVTPQGPDRVVISVRDNGVGIPPEYLARVFERGFTTKPAGHGFGLHSGWLAAREMGGQLTASSDGIGKGAMFCLELQVVPPQSEGKNNGNGNTDNFAPS